MAGKIAKKNEKVVINRDFSVIVPEGYTYSTDKSDINGNRKLVFIKTERNALFEKEYADFDECGLDAPFAAPQCMTVMEPRGLGAELDLSDSNVRAALRQMAEQFMTMFGGTVATAKESKDILVYYSKFKGKETSTQFMVVTAENIYNGQIWINDVATQKERTDLAKQWLTSAENYILTDADKVPVDPFIVPTYSENKRWQMGTLTVAIPDQLAHLGAEGNAFGDNLGGLLEFGRLMDEYAFLAIPKNYEGGFQDCHNAPLSFNCQHASVVQNPQLAALWKDTESVRVDRKTTFTDMVKNALDGMGREYPVHYKHLADRLDVVYAQSGERDDPIEYWRSYFIAFFHNDTIHQVNVHINAKKDVKAFDKAIEDWVSRVTPATEEEIAQYEKQKTIRALGPLAGKNGKIDGAKGTQLFFEDVFFFVKGQLLAKGKHHELKGLQVNTQAIDNYPQIKQNLSVFGTALTELINFVEQDELLVLDEECVHHAFDKLNKIDPMIINGTTVDVKGAKIGKGLSGARIFLLIAWHMIKIVEGEENTYIVALDQNIFKGIPKATAYVLQLIKRLREYNGRTDGFGAVFASTFNMDGGIDGAISGRNPLASYASMDAINVAEGEDPYAPVQKEIAEAKNKGVWDNWKRGHGVSDDDDDDFTPMDLGDFDLGDMDIPFDFPMEEPDVDEKGRIAPSDIKTSAKVKKAIKDIGAIGKSIAIKGKHFVLTEVMHPDILEKYITQNGGEVKSSTVLTTDYIILGDTGSGDTTKAKRALELNKTRGKNIKALSENDFWRMVADVQTPSNPNAGQPSNKANSLAEEIVAWFKSDDQLRPLADIQAHFSTHSKAEVKKTLDMLCNEDVLYGGENIIGNMYGLVSLENADDFLCRAPLMAPAGTPSPSAKDNAAQKKDEEKALADKVAAMEKKRQQIESNLKSVRSALSGVQEERRKAERAFNDAKRRIERMTSGSIDIFSYGLEDTIREIIHTANDAGEKLSETCVSLVKKLDKKCRPYIDDGMDPQLMKAIADELKELNETAVVDIDFSGSFEGTSFGHVGDIHYAPTHEAKSIENYWRSKARTAKSGDWEAELLKEFGISKQEYQQYGKYESAVEKFKKATTSAQIRQAQKSFEALKGYLDAESYMHKCEQKLPELIAKEKKEAEERAALEAKRKAEEEERARQAEIQRRESAYKTALAFMQQDTLQGYDSAIQQFQTISGHKDADSLLEQCRQRKELCRKDAIYATAQSHMHSDTIHGLERAIDELKKIPAHKDSDALIRECEEKIEEKKQQLALAALRAQRKKKLIITVIGVLCLLAILAFLLVRFVIPEVQYQKAVSLMDAGDYSAAIEAFDDNWGGYQYKDSALKIKQCKDAILLHKYNSGKELLEQRKYSEAYTVFAELGDYGDSATQCKEARYREALSYWNRQEYDISNEMFAALGTYKDSKDRIHVHEYTTEMTVEPGCETKGETKLTCKTCPHSYTEAVDATGHAYGEVHVTKAATCTATGIQEAVCLTCQKTVTETIAMIDHSYNDGVITTAATCEKDGVKTFSCHCGESYTETVNATGHSYNSGVITTAATCEKDGVKTFSCHCGESYTETVNATGHSYNSGVITTAATCEKDGVKTFSCHCGESYTETVNATGHSYNSGVITTAATCEKDGVKTFSCHCGKSYTETVNATGHNYSEATCTTDSVCANCNHVRQGALGHANQENRCSRCGLNLTPTFTSILGSGDRTSFSVSADQDVQVARGKYRITMTILSIDTKWINNYSLKPQINVWTGYSYNSRSFSKSYPDVVVGATFTYDVTYDKYDGIWGFDIHPISCTVEVKVEPID